MNALDEFPQLKDFEVFCGLVESDAVKRLLDVSFLGAVALFGPVNRDRHPRPGGSRFEHSVAVAYLAYLATMHLDRGQQETAISAALLHDIGHGPLSHSTEGFFKRRFNIDHKTEGRRLLRNDPQIMAVLRRSHLDPLRIENLAFGKQKESLSFLFHYPINIDTIEGITRCGETFGVSELIPTHNDLVLLLVEPNKDVQVVGDSFWKLKDAVYNHYILSPLGVASDVTCQLALERTKVSKSDFYLGDTAFLNKFRSSMDDVVTRLADSVASARLPYEVLQSLCRKFGINQEFEIRELNDLSLRYK